MDVQIVQLVDWYPADFLRLGAVLVCVSASLAGCATRTTPASNFRKVVKGTAFEGLHPHDIRHYVADVLDKAGLSARQIADYLGHERISTTQEDYMERGVVGEEAAAAMAAEPKPEKPKSMG